MKFEPQGEGEDQCPSCPPLTSTGGGGGAGRGSRRASWGRTFEPSLKSLGENFRFTVWSSEFEWFSYN